MGHENVFVIGGGLAGCEAAWQLARRGFNVTLYEMKPLKMSDAHRSPYLAELVCSNSFRSLDPFSAPGLLKEEMRRAGSIIMEAAAKTAIPAGQALAVDRERFSAYVTWRIETHPNIKVERKEIDDIPSDGIAIIATGPLTSERFSKRISIMTGKERLYFYDAISPIVDASSIDFNIAFRASRYNKGGDDYLNFPMNKEEYESFVRELVSAKRVPLRFFERPIFFEGCLPIEEMAEKGVDTLRFGPLKPVGLRDMRGLEPYAVVQLRAENLDGTMYNMVGFQTRLTYPEQKRVFRMIPGLGNAEFLRYGSMHRNTYINSPILLEKTLQFKKNERIFFAGQITGVEGYIESASMGIVAGIGAALLSDHRKPVPPPPESAMGALINYITDIRRRNFQPMKINFGLFPLPERGLGRAKRETFIVRRAIDALEGWLEDIDRMIPPVDLHGRVSL